MKYQAVIGICIALPIAWLASTNVVPAQNVKGPEYTEDGQVKLPLSWRTKWIFIGSPLTPNGLNDGKASFPEFHNVYIEPSAYAAYRKTRKFPEGTQILKELQLVERSDDPNGSATEPSGVGYFPGKLNGVDFTVKDIKRFPKAPGGWAYFNFGHHAPPYPKSAKAQPNEACAACHEASAGDDMVFDEFYSILKAD